MPVAVAAPLPHVASEQAAVATALRSATASIACLCISEWFHLDYAYLSVFTAHVVNLQYAHTPFQKSLERVIGRIAGICYCTILVIFFRGNPLLCLGLFAAALLVVWYVQASGRFAYGTLLAAVFMATTVVSDLESPPAYALHNLGHMSLQLLLGAFALAMVNFGTGAERSLAVVPGGQDLLPLRLEWVSRSMMLTTTTFATLLLIWLFKLPPAPTIVSAMILAATPSPEALQAKAFQRGAAILFILPYSVLVLLVLARIPALSLLVVFLFLVLFAGSYVAHVSTRYGYIGLQAGIAAPLVLVVSPAEIANLNLAFQRLVGVIAGFLMAIIFQEMWPLPWHQRQ